jgi:hypothetical protein
MRFHTPAAHSTVRARMLALVVAMAIAAVGLDARAPSSQPRWSARGTDHFDIYFELEQRSRVEEIAREAERVYARLSGLLHYDLAAKMDILLLAADGDYPRGPSQAFALVRASGASYRDHLVLSIESFDRQGASLIAHELTHQFMFELFPEGHRSADWITEALPDHHAGSWDAAALATLRDAVASGRIPDVASLTAADRHWGRAVFDFVATEYGARGVRAYLQAVRDSPSSMRDPIRIAFDTTPADFNAAFQGFARARFGR